MAATGNDVPDVPAAHVRTNAAHGEKPEKFLGSNFKQWKQKMLFYLTTLGLANYLNDDTPSAPVMQDTDPNAMSAETSQAAQDDNRRRQLAYDAWVHSDFLCKNYILNCLSDALYTAFCSVSTARDLWEKLDRKYSAQDAGTKKFVVGKFLNFKMADSKSVMSQVLEFQSILHELEQEGMKPNEPFLVASLIEKLPPSWNEFMSYLKLKTKEMGLKS